MAWLLVAGPATAQPALLPGVGVQDRRVMVDPERVPWRGVGRVQTELGGRCTGFLIGPRTVVTAAHCLFLTRPRNFVQPGSVHFVLADASGEFTGHSRVSRFTLIPGYDPLDEGRTAGADLAVLTLTEPLGTPDRLLETTSGPAIAGMRVMLGGYSRDRQERLEADPDCSLSDSAKDGAGRVLLRHDCEATNGTSGAPVLVHCRDGWRVLGVQIMADRDGAGGLAVPLQGAPEFTQRLPAARPKLRALLK